MTTRTITMLSAVAALAARPVTSEDEAITELTALTPEIARLRAFSAEVSTRLGGETDPKKAADRITELATSVATFKGQAEAAEGARLDGVVEGAMGELSAMDVRDRQVEGQSRQGSGMHLEAVA